MHLAMEEALVNAISHGNRSDPSKNLQIVCRLSAELIRAEMTDEGEGFDPKDVPDPTSPGRIQTPGGRGVMLMRAYMSQVEYESSGRRVILAKQRSKEQ